MRTKATNKLLALPIIATALIAASPANAATLIVAENFGGTGSDLNTTNADTFASAITTAGGSSTWAANAVFNDNGTLAVGNNDGAYLNMGSYINASKGTATGKFTLSVTLDSLPTSPWAGFGFFASNTPSINENFTDAASLGSGTLIWRNAASELDGFAGAGNANAVDGPDNVTSAPQLITIVLDLTTHNNLTNFGTISFYQGDGTGTAFGSHDYASDISFGSIGLTTAGNNVSTSYSGFTLTQVPEPSAALLGGIGFLFLLRRRR